MNTHEKLRIEDGWVIVPMVTMKRGERKIVLIGMLHVATMLFFETIMNRLIAYEKAGFQILYEEIENIPSAEKSTLDLLFEGLKKYDLYSQLDYIHIRPSWKSADVDQNFNENKDNNSNDIQETFDDAMLDPEKYIDTLLLPQLENPFLKIPNAEMVIDRRNKLATSIIIDYAKNANVATYWGCSHIPGMIDLLIQHEFEIDTTEWIRTININKLKTRNS